MATTKRRREPKRTANTSDEFMAVVDPFLAKHGATREQWFTTSMYAAACHARADVACHLRGLKWPSVRIAEAIGVTRSTVRRLLRVGGMAPPPAPPKIKHRTLPVVGPSMLNRRGVRRDCTRESECLRALLKQHDPHAPPQHSSCPQDCQWFSAPNGDLRRYDASIRPGGGVAV